MFLVDWLRHEAPFEPRPDPGTFLAVYEHYRAGWWGNQERSSLTPAACLALIRLLIGGQLELADCLGCRQPFARPAGGSMHAFRSLCPFCDFPHAAARPLPLPPRLSIAA